MARSRRSGRRRPGANSGPWIWIAISAFAIALILVAGGYAWVYQNAASQKVAVGEDLCPIEGPTGQTVVILDTTDTWPDLNRIHAETKLRDLLPAISKGQLLQLRVIEPGADVAKTVFSRCNPGDGSDLNDITGNPREARERWQSGFDVPLQAALDASMTGSGANSSPILAAVQKVAVEQLISDRSHAYPSRIIIISDGLEHTDAYSHYRDGADFQVFNKSPAAQLFRTDLAGAAVDLWIVGRSGAPVSADEVADFWLNWTVANHASDFHVTRLQGQN